jgi:hypothetical protein
MTLICAISVEGVLALDSDLKSAQPTKWARMLYDGLHNQYRMIAFTANAPDVADHWLRREMLRDWAGVMVKPDGYNSFRAWKIKQVEEFLAEGWEVGLVIDIDQVVLEQVNDLGVPTLLLSYPTKRVGWREPTPEVRAWTDVVSDLESDL